MLLAIDIGNTHTEIGLFSESGFVTSWRIATGVNRTEDEMMMFIHGFLSQENVKINDIQDLIIASVVPNITQIFIQLSRNYFKKEPLIVDDTIDLGISIHYDPPGSVGADRLCNAVSAYQRFGGPVVVVDFGTATTLDIVNAGGEYIGGAIAPGLELASLSLVERTSKLPKIPLKFPPSAIGRRTEESMQAGVMYGSVKMIDGLIEMFREELGNELKIVATGGLAPLISTKSRYIQHLEPNLVLDGLKRIYERMRSA